jgi:hypothetical protein
VLQEDQHEGGQRHHPEQAVAELRAAGDVGRPVARVDEADGDYETRPKVAQQLAREEVANRPAGGRSDGGPLRGAVGDRLATGAQTDLLGRPRPSYSECTGILSAPTI